MHNLFSRGNLYIYKKITIRQVVYTKVLYAPWCGDDDDANWCLYVYVKNVLNKILNSCKMHLSDVLLQIMCMHEFV